MLDKENMEADFNGLVGLSPIKPFECVGTVREIKFALAAAMKKLGKKNEKIPFLLKKFGENFNADEILSEPLLKDFNAEHNIPAEFLPVVREMYDYVSSESD